MKVKWILILFIFSMSYSLGRERLLLMVGMRLLRPNLGIALLSPIGKMRRPGKIHWVQQSYICSKEQVAG